MAFCRVVVNPVAEIDFEHSLLAVCIATPVRPPPAVNEPDAATAGFCETPGADVVVSKSQTVLLVTIVGAGPGRTIGGGVVPQTVISGIDKVVRSPVVVTMLDAVVVHPLLLVTVTV